MMDVEKYGLLFRDFFIAHDAEALKKACLGLCPQEFEFDKGQWLDAEYEFNSLFIGPSALLAPPYASVYLDDEPLVMGQATLSVRELAAQLGLTLERDENLPDDHIAYEIELLILLLINAKTASEYLPLLHRYFSQHFSVWLPVFIGRMKENAHTHILQILVLKFSQWVDELKVSIFNEQ